MPKNALNYTMAWKGLKLIELKRLKNVFKLLSIVREILKIISLQTFPRDFQDWRSAGLKLISKQQDLPSLEQL